MYKTYFVSYWDRKYNQVSNTKVKIYVIDMSQGQIAEEICSRLTLNSRLINFWEM